MFESINYFQIVFKKETFFLKLAQIKNKYFFKKHDFFSVEFCALH